MAQATTTPPADRELASRGLQAFPWGRGFLPAAPWLLPRPHHLTHVHPPPRVHPPRVLLRRPLQAEKSCSASSHLPFGVLGGWGCMPGAHSCSLQRCPPTSAAPFPGLASVTHFLQGEGGVGLAGSPVGCTAFQKGRMQTPALARTPEDTEEGAVPGQGLVAAGGVGLAVLCSSRTFGLEL